MVEQKMNGGMEGYGQKGSPFCGATMGGRCHYGQDDKCKQCKMSRKDKEGPSQTATKETVNTNKAKPTIQAPQR